MRKEGLNALWTRHLPIAKRKRIDVAMWHQYQMWVHIEGHGSSSCLLLSKHSPEHYSWSELLSGMGPGAELWALNRWSAHSSSFWTAGVSVVWSRSMANRGPCKVRSCNLSFLPKCWPHSSPGNQQWGWVGGWATWITLTAWCRCHTRWYLKVTCGPN